MWDVLKASLVDQDRFRVGIELAIIKSEPAMNGPYAHRISNLMYIHIQIGEHLTQHGYFEGACAYLQTEVILSRVAVLVMEAVVNRTDNALTFARLTTAVDILTHIGDNCPCQDDSSD